MHHRFSDGAAPPVTRRRFTSTPSPGGAKKKIRSSEGDAGLKITRHGTGLPPEVGRILKSEGRVWWEGSSFPKATHSSHTTGVTAVDFKQKKTCCIGIEIKIIWISVLYYTMFFNQNVCYVLLLKNSAVSFQCASISWKVLLSLNFYSACFLFVQISFQDYPPPPPPGKRAALFCCFSEAATCTFKRKPDVTAAGTSLCTRQTQDVKAALQVIKTVKSITRTQKTSPTSSAPSSSLCCLE